MQSVEANLGKLKVLPDSEETREMVQISIRLHEFVLRAYKTEYLQLAKLYDEGGYRTIMYINDGAGGPYGASLGSLAPVVSSWFNDVMSLNDYSGHPTSAAHGGIVRPMGRPSAVSMSGHENDSVLAVSWLPRATSLTIYWIPD